MNDGSASKHRRALLTSCFFVLAAASVTSSVRSAEAAQPATWQLHSELVELRNLPKHYSCSDLWYKFRDVLLRLGASPRMDILPYRCERSTGPAARSPQVRLKFYAPRPLAPPNTKGADLTVSPRVVRIAPGEPPSIDTSDCALLRQMQPVLPGRVLTYRLPCRAPSSTNPPFSVTVQALIPEPSPTVPVAQKPSQTSQKTHQSLKAGIGMTSRPTQPHGLARRDGPQAGGANPDTSPPC